MVICTRLLQNEFWMERSLIWTQKENESKVRIKTNLYKIKKETKVKQNISLG
jgi:hypothetical protein